MAYAIKTALAVVALTGFTAMNSAVASAATPSRSTVERAVKQQALRSHGTLVPAPRRATSKCSRKSSRRWNCVYALLGVSSEFRGRAYVRASRRTRRLRIVMRAPRRLSQSAPLPPASAPTPTTTPPTTGVEQVTGLGVQMAAEDAVEAIIAGYFATATCPIPWADSANGKEFTCTFRALSLSSSGSPREGSVVISVSPEGEMSSQVTIDPPKVFPITVEIEVDRRVGERYPANTPVFVSCSDFEDAGVPLNGKPVACTWTALPSDGIYKGTASGTVSTQGEINITTVSDGTFAPYAPASGCYVAGYYEPGFYVGGIWVPGYSVPGFYYC